MLTPRFAPPSGHTLLIIGQDVPHIEEYVRSGLALPAGFAAYTSADKAEGLHTSFDQGGGFMHASALLKYPHTVMQLAIYMVGMEEKIYTGQAEAGLQSISDWIKVARRPVYLRIGYEFDFPENKYDPEKYVRAFRYIVDFLRQRGVNNVAAVWHSYAAKVERPHRDWYPGDDYVDWFAITYFDQQSQVEMRQMSALAKERAKPLMIAEACPWKMSADPRSWQAWLEGLFKFIQDEDARALTYINWDWEKIPMFQGQGWGDSRVQSNRQINAIWQSETGQKRYLKASPGLFEVLGYQP